MPLFHVSSAQFDDGQILSPGAWGRFVREFQKDRRPLDNVRDAKNLIWECCLETARRTLASHAPSRLDCVFTCKTLQDANSFRDRFRANAAAVYEVAPVSATSPTFEGDYDLITASSDQPFVDVWIDRSIRYWTSEPQGIAEVLVGGDVRVSRRV